MWSMPWISPLAIDGAAPRMTTNVIASSVSLNSRIASGNQAIEGMVWSPVISEPIAERMTANCATRIPIRTPMTTASPNPQIPRRSVVQTACHVSAWPRSEATRAKTSNGPGRTQTGCQADQTTSCHSATAMASAISFGQVAAQARRPIDDAGSRGASRASSPATSNARVMSGTGSLAPPPPWRATSSRRRVVIRPASADTSGSSIRRGRGMSTANSSATRPGRLVRSTIRSPSRAASRTLWVTNRIDRRVACQIRSSSSWRMSRVIASSAPNGSSISRTSVS